MSQTEHGGYHRSHAEVEDPVSRETLKSSDTGEAVAKKRKRLRDELKDALENCDVDRLEGLEAMDYSIEKQTSGIRTRRHRRNRLAEYQEDAKENGSTE